MSEHIPPHASLRLLEFDRQIALGLDGVESQVSSGGAAEIRDSRVPAPVKDDDDWHTPYHIVDDCAVRHDVEAVGFGLPILAEAEGLQVNAQQIRYSRRYRKMRTSLVR